MNCVASGTAMSWLCDGASADSVNGSPAKATPQGPGSPGVAILSALALSRKRTSSINAAASTDPPSDRSIEKESVAVRFVNGTVSSQRPFVASVWSS